MRLLRITVFLFLAINLSAFGQAPASSRSSSLAYVFDPSLQSISAIDLLSGKETAKAQVDGSSDIGRDLLALTPDGSRLAMFIDGSRSGHTPTSKSTATIIDAKTMKPFQPIDIGWRFNNYSITPDSRVLITVSSGTNSTQSRTGIPGEIVATNLSSGQVIERIPIPRQITGSLISRDGKTAILFFAKQKEKGGHYSTVELQFISLEKQASVGTITFDGTPEMPFFSPTGDFIYLLERGRPSHNPRENFNGKIQVISVKEMKIAAVLDAGSNPKIALADDEAGQTLILSDGAPVPTHNQIVDAEVRVLRGASIAGILKVGNGVRYLSFSPDRKRLCVTSTFDYSGYEGLPADKKLETDPTSYSSTHKAWIYSGFDLLTVIDYTSLKVLGQIPLDGSISSVIFTPDGSRGFTLNPKSKQVLPIDLQALKAGVPVSTGRDAVKAAHFVIGSVEASASMFFPLAGIAFSAADNYLNSSEKSLMFVRPDGAFVYVLNQGTHDVTVVNTNNSSVVTKIAAGGRRIQPLQGGSVLAVLGGDSIHRIDTSTQKALPEIKLGSFLIDFSLSPDGHTAVALVDGAVVLLDGATGELRNRIDEFKRPIKVIYAQPEQSTGISQ